MHSLNIAGRLLGSKEAFFFCPLHSSSLSQPGTMITRYATRPQTIQSEIWVRFECSYWSLELLASKKRQGARHRGLITSLLTLHPRGVSLISLVVFRPDRLEWHRLRQSIKFFFSQQLPLFFLYTCSRSSQDLWQILILTSLLLYDSLMSWRNVEKDLKDVRDQAQDFLLVRVLCEIMSQRWILT